MYKNRIRRLAFEKGLSETQRRRESLLGMQEERQHEHRNKERGRDLSKGCLTGTRGTCSKS